MTPRHFPHGLNGLDAAVPRLLNLKQPNEQRNVARAPRTVQRGYSRSVAFYIEAEGTLQYLAKKLSCFTFEKSIHATSTNSILRIPIPIK